MDIHLHYLKRSLQQHGAVQPQAWTRIVEFLQIEELAPGDSLLRDRFAISFLGVGLLKEYAIVNRKRPRIVHFLSSGNFFYHSRHHAKRYVKAITPAIVYNIEATSLQLLGSEFKELNAIYAAICEIYDDQLANRGVLLEASHSVRIANFKTEFASALPYLKKKDIAQYLSISYNYLIESWNH